MGGAVTVLEALGLVPRTARTRALLAGFATSAARVRAEHEERSSRFAAVLDSIVTPRGAPTESQRDPRTVLNGARHAREPGRDAFGLREQETRAEDTATPPRSSACRDGVARCACASRDLHVGRLCVE